MSTSPHGGSAGPSHDDAEALLQAEEPALRRAEWEPGTTSTGASTTLPERAALQLAGRAAAARTGERLGTKEELRAACGVSVGTFNEALRLAQARGVVVVRPGRTGGIFATRQSPLVRLGHAILALDPDAAEATDAVRLRDALSPLLVEDAVRQASDDDLRAMRKALGRLRRAVADTDGGAFRSADASLLGCIVAVSPDPVLRSLSLGLLEILDGHALSPAPFDEHLCGRYEHRAALVEAIADHDAARATALVRQAAMTSTPAAHGDQAPGSAAAAPRGGHARAKG